MQNKGSWAFHVSSVGGYLKLVYWSTTMYFMPYPDGKAGGQTAVRTLCREGLPF